MASDSAGAPPRPASGRSGANSSVSSTASGSLRAWRSITPAPPPPDDPEQHLETALDTGTRTDALIASAVRTLQQLTTGLAGARESNEATLRELEQLRALVGTNDQQQLLREQLERLTEQRDRAVRALDEGRAEAARERAFLIQEQDKFIKTLLDDHEKALAKVVRERDEALVSVFELSDARKSQRSEAGPDDLRRQLDDARESIERLTSERARSLELLRRLQTQRDDLHVQVERLLAERDAARAKLSRLQAAEPGFRHRATEPPDAPDAAEPLLGERAPGASLELPDELAAAERSWRLAPPPAPLSDQAATAETSTGWKQKTPTAPGALGGYSVRPTPAAAETEGGKGSRR